VKLWRTCGYKRTDNTKVVRALCIGEKAGSYCASPIGQRPRVREPRARHAWLGADLAVRQGRLLLVRDIRGLNQPQCTKYASTLTTFCRRRNLTPALAHGPALRYY
jgi:hypothetical protein